MWPFLLGLVGWAALLLWGWVQVGRSLGDSVRNEVTAKKQPAAGTIRGGVEQRDPHDVNTTLPHD
jgi:hypothetical protein